ncbi:MAG: TonB-dependent siderophore receptor [Azospirillum brasilense]|nr:MAG: TonB-dependent siderophore receptor [Azospirillum brasilense]
MARNAGRRKPRGWRTAGWVLAALAAASPAGRALAQSRVEAPATAFSIPPGPIGGALTRFGEASGLRVLALSQELEGRRSPGVSGRMPAEEALRRLLAGTGLGYRFSDAGSVTIVVLPPPAATGGVAVDGDAVLIPPVDVQGRGGRGWAPAPGLIAEATNTGTKTDTPIIETPQSISVVTRDQMDRQAVQTVSDALRFVPGVVTGTAGNQTRYDSIFLRGFGGFANDSAFVNYMDGLKLLRDVRISPQIDPWALERVEVFRGPSSVLYGQANPGGFVNLVSRRPTETRFGEVNLQAGTNERKQAAFDLGGPIDADGKFLYRLTGLMRNAESDVPYQSDRRVLIAPALTWRPDADTSITFLGQYQHDADAPNFGIAPYNGSVLPNINGRLPATFFQGDPNWNELQRTQWLGGWLAEHRLNNVFTIRQNFRYQNFSADTKDVSIGSLAADQRSLSRTFSLFRHRYEAVTLDNQVQADFATGPLSHTLLVGLDYQHLWGDFRFGQTAGPALDIFQPVYGVNFTAPTLTNMRKTDADQIGIYVQDQVRLDHWVLSLGGRHDWADSRLTSISLAARRGSTSEQSDSAFTGKAGLLYLFDNGIAPYVSYSESFEPQIGTTLEGKAYEPTEGRQYEAGIKYQPPGRNSFVTLAAYNLTRTNLLTPDLRAPTLYSVQTGEVRVRGIELEAKARLLDGLDVLASYALQDAEVTKDNGTASAPSAQGKRPTAVPRNTASAWAEYTFAGGPLNALSVGGGIRYVGSTYADRQNTIKVDSYTLWDASIRYDLGANIAALKGMSLAVNGQNIGNQRYVAACDQYNGCYFGARRSVIATLRYRW